MDGFPLLLRYLTRSKSFGPVLPIETMQILVSSGFAPGGPASVLYRKCWGATCRRRRTRTHRRRSRSAGVPTKKHRHKDSEGSDLPKTQEMTRRGDCLAQDSDKSNQGRDSVGSDLVEDERCGRRSVEVPKIKRGSGLVVGAGHRQETQFSNQFQSHRVTLASRWNRNNELA